MLLAIFVLAVLLRVVALDAQGLWTDEALTIVLSNWPVSDLFLRPIDPTPALYYVIHKALIPANASLEAVRSISVVAGVMSVGLIYLLGRLAFGAAGGLLAAALLAVWSAHVDYSQEARAYSLLFLLTLLTSLGLVYFAHALRQAAGQPSQLDRGRRWFALALFCVGNILAFYTHVIATFWIVFTSLLLLAIVWQERRHHWPQLFAVFGVMAVGAAPGIYRLVLQMRAGDQFHWLGQADLIEFANTSATVFLPVGLWDNPLTNALGARGIAEVVVAATSLALLGAGCWFGRQVLYRSVKGRPVIFWLILAYLMVPVAVWLFGFIARPLFIDRTILFAVPGMILLITAVCLALGRRVASRAAIGVVLLYCASTLSFGIVREKEDWRGAYTYLAASASPTDVIAVCPLYNYPALRYHAVSPVASAVLGMAGDGRLLEVEHGLGTNPDWDKTYFRHLLVPEAARWRLTAQDVRVPALLDLRPGQSIWRVEGHCNPGFADDLDAALNAISPDPDIAWSQKRKDPHAFSVTVRRYRVVAPVTLDVQDIATHPQSLPPFLSSARVP